MHISRAFWRKAAVLATLIFAPLIFALLLSLHYEAKLDKLYWPTSGQSRIEDMASILRRMREPARWCYPSGSPDNLYVFDPDEAEKEFGRCISSIAPASDFQETEPHYYIKRFYRADIGDRFCEFTLSTVYDNDRLVGSDCYFGLFSKEKDTGVGMTDDEFG